MEMIYFLVMSLLLLLVFLFLYIDAKKDLAYLMKLNNSLDEEISGYKVVQSELLDKVKSLESLSSEQMEDLIRVGKLVEERKFVVGSKVSWVDKSGEDEFGLVCDDFVSEDKLFIVVRSVKNGNLTRRYFTIGADRVKLV